MLIPPTEKTPGPFLNENIGEFIHAIFMRPERLKLKKKRRKD